MSELIKSGREDKVVRLFVRILVIAIVSFACFGLLLLAITLWKGKTAKIAGKEYSLPTGDSTTLSKTLPVKTDTSKPKMSAPSTKSGITNSRHKYVAAPAPTKPSDSLKAFSTVQTNTNGVNVNGNNNTTGSSHVFNGSGNQFNAPFINGDLNLGRDLELSEQSITSLFKLIDDLVRNKGFDAENISVIPTPFCNAPGISGQIIRYFKARGYSLNAGFMAENIPTFNDMQIDTSGHLSPHQKQINIYLGIFK